MKKDIYNLQVEIQGISAIVGTIRLQFDEGNGRMQDQYIDLSLRGVMDHLDRIVEDLEELDERLVERGGDGVSVKVKVSYESGKDLERLIQLLSPEIKEWKVKPQRGQYKRAYIVLRSSTSGE